MKKKMPPAQIPGLPDEDAGLPPALRASRIKEGVERLIGDMVTSVETRLTHYTLKAVQELEKEGACPEGILALYGSLTHAFCEQMANCLEQRLYNHAHHVESYSSLEEGENVIC